MRLIFTIKHLALATPIIAYVLMPSISLAGPNDGVKCQTGYNADFNGGVLKCSKQVGAKPEFRKSVCNLIPFVGTIYKQKEGVDECTRNDNGGNVKTVPENAFDPKNYEREVDVGSGTLDRFRKGETTRTEFVYPQQL